MSNSKRFSTYRHTNTTCIYRNKYKKTKAKYSILVGENPERDNMKIILAVTSPVTLGSLSDVFSVGKATSPYYTLKVF